MAHYIQQFIFTVFLIRMVVNFSSFLHAQHAGPKEIISFFSPSFSSKGREDICQEPLFSFTFQF